MEDVIKKNVDHPSHYNQEGRKECIVEMREKFGDLAVYWFCKLNAFKYNYRGGDKEGNSAEQDAAKAKWYDSYGDGLIGSMKVTDIGQALAPWEGQLRLIPSSLERTLGASGSPYSENHRSERGK